MQLSDAKPVCKIKPAMTAVIMLLFRRFWTLTSPVAAKYSRIVSYILRSFARDQSVIARATTLNLHNQARTIDQSRVRNDVGLTNQA